MKEKKGSKETQMCFEREKGTDFAKLIFWIYHGIDILQVWYKEKWIYSLPGQ